MTEQALDVMDSLGATIVDIPIAQCPDPNAWFDPEFTVLFNEFKHDVAAYMSTLRNTEMRTLADLIQFNIDHCPEEMQYFGQEPTRSWRTVIWRSSGRCRSGGSISGPRCRTSCWRP